jgi:hypothetical protein
LMRNLADTQVNTIKNLIEGYQTNLIWL